jgi:hypothetical protein
MELIRRFHPVVITSFVMVGAIKTSSSETIEMSRDAYDNFRNSKSNGMIQFYQSWSGNSIRLAHDWDRLGKEDFTEHVFIGKVDCGNHDKFCKEKDVHNWPTVFYYKDGTEYMYRGSLAYEDLSMFILEEISPRCKLDDTTYCSEKAKSFVTKWNQKTSNEHTKEIIRLEMMLKREKEMKLDLRRWIKERIMILKSGIALDHGTNEL